MRVAEVRELQGKGILVVKNKRVVSGCGCGVRGGGCGGAGRGEAADRSRPGAGLGNELCGALSAWRRPWSVHDPGKVMADPAVRAALGGRCLSDLSPRCEKEILGSVASDPTVSRLVGTLTDHVEAAEAGPARQRDSGRGPRPASTHRPPVSGRTDRRCLGGPAAGDRHRRHSGGRPLGEIEDTAPTLQEGAR